MKAPDKIFIRDFGNSLCQVWTRDKGKKKGDVDIEYLRKEVLMEWLEHAKKLYNVCGGHVFEMVTLQMVIDKINSL